ncbi:CMP/dCMP deaminase zinc-binding protein [Halorubrum aidingense JCM 13560]|uniref:CMP/dCMP deaminase zinc-binding protein n=1 Tax=Halorubrum aidingense JCM 13560 TaxID=1230454 RepID=M0PCU5_9EURY|nr:nucleoside deaminase [Halorubrum aidingense]EMA67856.1 CMP/dCMP deaminase zinc-binding protein [Halorubrum aidingense JCM 13560]
MTDGTDPSGGPDDDPHTAYEYVDRAIDLASQSVDAGNTPFGALIVVDGEIVGEGHNETRTGDDIAAHPEMTLARWAARELDPDERARCTMYASTEPCPMCATAIHYAGLDRVVFGVDGETLNDLSGDVVPIPCEEVIRRADGDTTVEGPIATEAAMSLHRSFYGEQ